eukprot:6474883-Amphidinium_carterae.1
MAVAKASLVLLQTMLSRKFAVPNIRKGILRARCLEDHGFVPRPSHAVQNYKMSHMEDEREEIKQANL